jgi:hypothetical protein
MEDQIMNRRRFCALAWAAALLTPIAALAENSTSVGGYTIHHNAFTTSTLTPEVAKAYGIQRSNFRGMLNVSVVKDTEETTGSSVPAQVEVQTVELTGQKNRLPMREVKEQDAIYYIGEFAVQDGQTVNFSIEVKPHGAAESFVINMDQQFFGN